MPTPTLAEQLAAFVARASYHELSAAAREQLKIRVLDSLGCAIGALDGEHRPRGGDVPRLGEHASVGVGVRGVDDEQIAVHAAIEDEVVDDAAALVRQESVLGLPGVDPVEVVREPRLEVGMRALVRELELPHVRDVEDARALPDCPVLLDDRGELDGQLPAGEGDEARAEGGVALVQRRSPERLHRGLILARRTGRKAPLDGVPSCTRVVGRKENVMEGRFVLPLSAVGGSLLDRPTPTLGKESQCDWEG